MAMAKVYGPSIDLFNPPRVVVGGWSQDFPVFFHGPDVPNGYMVDSVSVDFLDGDTAFVMDNKVRDAARVKGTDRGLSVPLTGVISFAPPRRL